MAGPDAELAAKLEPDVPHSARIWNYWLGGKDNFPADRAAGDAVAEVYPEIVDMARAVARVPRPGRALPGRRGGHPAVPGHRHRPAHHAEHPRGRPAASRPTRGSSTSTTTRWCWCTPGRCWPARRRGRHRPTSTPTTTTRRRSSPRRRRRSTSTSPIARDVHGRARPRARPRRGALDRRARRWTRCPPAATWCSGTAPTPARRWSPAPSGWRRAAGSRTSCAARRSSTSCFDGLTMVEPGLVPIPLWRPDEPDVDRDRRLRRGGPQALTDTHAAPLAPVGAERGGRRSPGARQRQPVGHRAGRHEQTERRRTVQRQRPVVRGVADRDVGADRLGHPTPDRAGPARHRTTARRRATGPAAASRCCGP